MELLERIWEVLAGIGNGILGGFEKAITSLFGSANARYLKRLQPKVDAINALEAKYQALSDEQLARRPTCFANVLRLGRRWTICWSKPLPSAAKRGGGSWGCGTTTCN